LTAEHLTKPELLMVKSGSNLVGLIVAKMPLRALIKLLFGKSAY
jgi:hypothetical protein